MLVQRGKEGRGEAGEGRGEWSLGRCGEEGRGDGTREEREERSPRLAGPVRRRGEGEGRRGRIEGRGNRADAERRGGARGVVAGLVQRGGKGLGDSGKKGEEGPPPLPLLTLQWWKLPMTLPAAATAATAAAPPIPMSAKPAAAAATPSPPLQLQRRVPPQPSPLKPLPSPATTDDVASGGGKGDGSCAADADAGDTGSAAFCTAAWFRV